jgi:hypothetical protein
MFSRRYTVKNWTSGKSLLAAFNFPGCLVLPFFSLLLLVFLLSFLSCIRTKTGFLSQWGLGGWMRILGNFFETDSHRFWSRFSFCSKHSTSISILPLGSITCLLILLYTPWSAKSLNCLKKKKNVFTTTGFKVRLNWRISFQDRE